MQQQGIYGSVPYYQYSLSQNANPSPNPSAASPSDHPHQGAYASAPPFTTNYIPSDNNAYPSNHSPIAPPHSIPSTDTNFQSFNAALQSSSFPSFESHLHYQLPAPQQSYYPPYDHHQTAPPSFTSPPPSVSVNPNPVPAPNDNSLYSSLYSSPYGSSVPPVHENQYEYSFKLDQSGGYNDNRYGDYSRSRSDFSSDPYVKRYDSSLNDGYGDGVYAYQGGKVHEGYGASSKPPKSLTLTAFDDYGRPISFPSDKRDSSMGSSKIVKAIPKLDTEGDVKSGVQKFRVEVLGESGGQSSMDVLCQIGLDGIRMLDPNTGRTLRIYPLENITRCEVSDSSTLAIWSKSSVDIEPKRIRLKSNSYTTNSLLDTVTAATVQFKEMGGRSMPTDSLKADEQPSEKKKGFGDWMNMIKPANEEKDHWVPDEAVSKCTACGTDFGAFVRRHHCRNCGDIFCDKCTRGRIVLTAEENAPQVRVCDQCMAEVTQRLTNAKEAAWKPAGFQQSHEDLAKKLQDEMEKNRRVSGSKSDASGRRMKEVSCPTCTVHLQVEVPSSGSETIECGVCQHPFLVTAR